MPGKTKPMSEVVQEADTSPHKTRAEHYRNRFKCATLHGLPAAALVALASKGKSGKIGDLFFSHPKTAWSFVFTGVIYGGLYSRLSCDHKIKLKARHLLSEELFISLSVFLILAATGNLVHVMYKILKILTLKGSKATLQIVHKIGEIAKNLNEKYPNMSKKMIILIAIAAICGSVVILMKKYLPSEDQNSVIIAEDTAKQQATVAVPAESYFIKT